MDGSENWHDYAASAARQAGKLHLASITGKLEALHRQILSRHEAIEHLALAVVDPDSRRLQVFTHSAEAGEALCGYECPFDEIPFLLGVARSNRPCVHNDLPAELPADCRHARWLLEAGFLASLTLPVDRRGELLGFLIFNTRVRDLFAPTVVDELTLFGHFAGMAIAEELAAIRTLVGGLRLAGHFAHLRDDETGAHIERTAAYAHLVARELAPAHGMGDAYVEHIALFAPLHDIGKVGIPDRILLKPGRLDEVERELMNRHVALGLEMTERLIANFGLGALPEIELLRNIVGAHHERMDGSGYPGGLVGDEITLEARIVATADVFDALMGARSYKRAWTLDDAFREIRSMAGDKLYRPSVEAVLDCRAEVEAIQRRFDENTRPYR